jgi:hypothetical protein
VLDLQYRRTAHLNKLAPALATQSTFDVRLPATDSEADQAAFLARITGPVRGIAATKLVAPHTVTGRMGKVGLLGLYLEEMKMGKYFTEVKSGVWEPKRDAAGHIKKPPPELLCWVILAQANRGRALDAEGNVVLVGATRGARRGAARPSARLTRAFSRCARASRADGYSAQGRHAGVPQPARAAAGRRRSRHAQGARVRGGLLRHVAVAAQDHHAARERVEMVLRRV